MAMQSMTSENGHSEEESFVVLGSTSPKPSIDLSLLQSRILEETLGSYGHPQSKIGMNGSQNIFETSCNEINSSIPLKINFKMEPLPSPASLIVADSIVTTCSNHSDMQIKIGELLDENTILKETLTQNNNSLKEQFKTIVDWQEDVMKAHHLQKSKFAQTKELIDKLRFENTHLKSELESMKDNKLAQAAALSTSTATSNSGNSGNFECLGMNADESTITNLTEQLEIVERQRRQVVADNERVLNDRDSLLLSVDLMKSENEELKCMIRNYEEEKKNNPLIDGNYVKSLELKITTLQTDLKNSQIKLLESENLKLEHTQVKLDSQEIIIQLNTSIMELKNRLREAHTIAFQPVRYALSLEAQCDSSEFSNFLENVKLYDKSLKDLAAYLNQHSNDFSTIFERVTQEVDKIFTATTEPTPQAANQFLLDIKQIISSHHKTTSTHNYQIKSCLTMLEKIFLDYQQVLKILKSEESQSVKNSEQHRKALDELTAKTVNQEEDLAFTNRELGQLRLIIEEFQKDSDERDLLKAQIEVYKTDFEAEREARTQMASEKQQLVTSLRTLQKTNQDLLEATSGNVESNSIAVRSVTVNGALDNLRRSGFQTTESPLSENGQMFPEEPESRTPTTIPEETAAQQKRVKRPRHGHPPVFALSFHGGAEADTERFIERCERFFRSAETDSNDQATKAATAFHGEALQWWQSLENKPTSWEGFTFALQRKYSNLGRKIRLEYEVKSVRQKENENAYIFLERKRAIARVCATKGDPLELARTIQGLMTPRDQERTDRLRWTTLDELVEAVRALELRSSREEEAPTPARRKVKEPALAETGVTPACGHQSRGAWNFPPPNPEYRNSYNVPPPPLTQSPNYQPPRRRSPGRRPHQQQDNRPQRDDGRPPHYQNRGPPRRDYGPLRC